MSCEHEISEFLPQKIESFSLSEVEISVVEKCIECRKKLSWDILSFRGNE